MKARKFLSLALAVAMTAGLLTLPAAAAELEVTWLPDGITWEDYSGPRHIPELHWINVKRDGNEAVFNLNTNSFVEEYKAVSPFVEGRARVQKMTEKRYNRYYGFLDESGELVIPMHYSEVDDFSHGVTLGYIPEGEGYYMPTYITRDGGSTGLPYSKFTAAGSYCDGLLRVKGTDSMGNEKYGFINEEDEVVIPLEYDWANGFAEGLTVAEKDKQVYILDTAGKVVGQFPEGVKRSYAQFSDGLLRVEPAVYDGGKCGYVDRTGTLVIPIEHKNAKDFCGGIAAVQLGDKWGFIDKTGSVVGSERFDWAGSEDGLCWVRNGERYGVVTASGVAATPAATSPAAATAYPSTQKVDVDGKAIEFQCYALKDANGNDTNYIKLRDLADILNGSAVQFEVGWNGQVTITTGKGYTKNGSEQNTPFKGQQAYKEVTAPTLVNGEARDLAAFTLTDDKGGGYTYYKLRDLGEALGFKVDWTRERGIFIETK